MEEESSPVSNRPNQEENWATWEQYNPRTGNWLSDTKDILIRFFQDFFYGMPAGEQPSLFHFEPSGEGDYGTSTKETEIIISDSGTVNTESVEKRPLLIINRGPFAYGNTSMDHLQSVRGSDDKKTFTDLLTGSFTLHCIAREGLEARVATYEARVAEAQRLRAEQVSQPCDRVLLADTVGAARFDLSTLSGGMEKREAMVTVVRKGDGAIAKAHGGVQISLAVPLAHQKDLDLRQLVPQGMATGLPAGLLSNTAFLLHCSEAVWEGTILPALRTRMQG